MYYVLGKARSCWYVKYSIPCTFPENLVFTRPCAKGPGIKVTVSLLPGCFLCVIPETICLKTQYFSLTELLSRLRLHHIFLYSKFFVQTYFLQ